MMASGTASTPAESGPGKRKRPAEKIVGYDQFIDGHLRKTRSQVKWVEISSAAMTLLAGTLGYLLVLVVLDHWLIPGGLGFWGRVAALALLVLGAGGYFVLVLAPLLLRRVNPVYAAHAIEQSRPTLKNSLVNFLLLRSNHEGVSESVYQAIEQQAATRLSQVQVESAVDRTKLIRIFAVLTGMVAVSCLYLVASPKNPLSTVRRVVLPWADIAAPTRVTIDEVSPGDTSTFYDGYVTVEAVVRGIDSDDPVSLVYSTADGQTVEQAIPMQRPAGAYRHTATLPAGAGGLQQHVSYYVAAGDARSNLYQVEVRPAPTIVVEQVEYQYPKYTGMEPALRQHGDLKAIEGTRVTLHARANQDILAAWLDLDCKGQRNKSFKSNEREASVLIPLRMAADRHSQEFSSYQVRFTSVDRHENPQPIRHTVDVVRDQPPEIRFDAPTEPQVELEANGQLELKVRARDPDFALSRVEILAERVNQSGDLLVSEPLLAAQSADEQKTSFEASYRFDPARLKLVPGDIVRYWAQARDNRQPNDDEPAQPNISETDKFKIVIVEPTKSQPRENELAKNDPPRDRQPNDDAPRDGDPRQQQGEGGQKGEQGQKGDKNQPSIGKNDQPGEGQPSADDNQPTEGDPMPNGNAGGQKQQSGDDRGQRGEASQEDSSKGDQSKGDASKGEPSDGQGEQGEPSDDRRVDPMSNPGDAFEEALKHLKQQEQQKSDKNQQSESKSSDSQQQNGSQREKAQQQNEQQPNESQQSKDDQGSSSKPGDNAQPMPGQDGAGAQQQPEANGKQPGSKGDRSGQQKGAANAPQDGQEPGDPNQPGDKPQAGVTNSPSSKGQSGDKQQPGDSKPQPGDADDAANPAERSPMKGEPQPSDKGTASEKAKPGEDNKGTKPPDSPPQSDGQGGQQKGEAQPGEKSTMPPGKDPQSPGGDPNSEKGNTGGAGKPSDEPMPTPEAQGNNQSRGDKQSTPDQAADKTGDSAKSPSRSDKQSDSVGGQDGDQSGGGKEGGGQAGSGAGTGAPGSNTPSDDGAKQAPGSGKGDTSDQAGNKVQSDKPTGNADPNQGRGDGSQQQPGSDKPGGQPDQRQPNQPNAEQSEQPAQPGQPDSQPNQGAGNQRDAGKPQPDRSTERQGQPSDPSNAGDSAAGSGQPGGNQGKPTPGKPGADGQQPGEPGDKTPQADNKPDEARGDAANVEYANKATDLALEHLKDQLNKDQPDQDLLDKLKWSREDLQRFVDHWEKMKRDAQAPGEAGQAAGKKLSESLKGLGLKPSGTGLKSNENANDRMRELRGARRTAPPAEYAEQVKAYKQRLAKGQNDGK